MTSRLVGQEGHCFFILMKIHHSFENSSHFNIEEFLTPFAAKSPPQIWHIFLE